MSRRGREEEREREWRRLRRVRRFAWITLLSKGSPSLSLSLLFVPDTETQVVLIFRSDFWMKGEEEVKREACLNLKMVENYPGSRYMSNSLLSIQM